MAVPKRMTPRARTLKRRSHHALVPAQRVRCKRCNSWMLPHTICETCGHYRGKALILPAEET